jgi:uncharacterized ferritin-like protein (DUF455 family)
MPRDTRLLALDALLITHAVDKAHATLQLDAADQTMDTQVVIAEPPGVPGRPAQPALVPPKDAPKRSLHTLVGHATTIHAITHIEFNAINLALDVVFRFAGMPLAFYQDWLRVAREEAKHFLLLNAHLASLGYRYGDFAAHGSLWEMAEKTQHDLLARLALVPRTLEARGLDATPPMRKKLHDMGDAKGAAILDIILHDEIGHVAIGNHWYRQMCLQQGLDAVEIYPGLALKYKAPKLRGPFNLSARKAAGFEIVELEALAGL